MLKDSSLLKIVELWQNEFGVGTTNAGDGDFDEHTILPRAEL